jgi:hypothetical protein
MKKILSCFFLLLCLFAGATIRPVPGSYASIQQAIDASVHGDTVLVSPGIYFENLNFRGRNLVLTSRFYLDKDTSFICSTVINGGMPTHTDSASCIILNHNEDSTAVIQGFTITGGLGSKWLDVHGAGTYREGGGIITEFASPIIRWNRIVNNYVTNTSGVSGTGGGGIRCGDGHPLIYGNVIEYNKAGYGCGIVMNYCHNAQIKNNLIVHNSGGQNYGGGGLWATGTNTNTLLYVENNTIANNHISGMGTYGGKGGGIVVFSIKLITQNNIIFNNTQSSGNSIAMFFGGQLTATYSDIDVSYSGTGNINADPLFTDTTFFALSPVSPCIDAGNPAAPLNDATVTANMAQFPSMGAETNDMGAYGGPLAFLLSTCHNLTTGLATEKDRTEISVYPNPAKEKFVVSSMDGFKTGDHVALFNAFGQVVFEEMISSTRKVIEVKLEALKAGMYIIWVQQKNRDLYRQIVLVE